MERVTVETHSEEPAPEQAEETKTVAQTGTDTAETDISPLRRTTPPSPEEQSLAISLDKHSLEAVVELKISRFLDQIGTYYPDNMHDMIMKTTERPLLRQILLRTGGNQVQAAKILGINRNTLRKKMTLFDL